MSRRDKLNNPEPSVVLMALNTLETAANELDLLQFMLREAGLELNIKQVQGRWAGNEEVAYVIEVPNARVSPVLRTLIDIADRFNQEEIWVLLEPYSNGKRRAYRLREPDFKHAEHIGYFVPCTQSKAYTQAGWTFDANTGQHYVLEEN